MCLDKITKVYKPSLYNLWIPKFAYKSGVGWKEFVFREDLLYPYYFKTRLILEKRHLKVNQFLHEKDYRPVNNMSIINDLGYDCLYNSGWHIFLEKPHYSSRNFSILRKVEYKQGHTIGIDKWMKVIVAKYMKILEE